MYKGAGCTSSAQCWPMNERIYSPDQIVKELIAILEKHRPDYGELADTDESGNVLLLESAELLKSMADTSYAIDCLGVATAWIINEHLEAMDRLGEKTTPDALLGQLIGSATQSLIYARGANLFVPGGVSGKIEIEH